MLAALRISAAISGGSALRDARVETAVVLALELPVDLRPVPAARLAPPRPRPRGGVSSHSSGEPSTLTQGSGRGGWAVRRRSWSSENRAVCCSPSSLRAVTSRAPRRATLPHFLAPSGSGSSS
jgi:hypothetical protein